LPGHPDQVYFQFVLHINFQGNQQVTIFGYGINAQTLLY
jgi:hypothetical protein